MKIINLQAKNIFQAFLTIISLFIIEALLLSFFSVIVKDVTISYLFVYVSLTIIILFIDYKQGNNLFNSFKNIKKDTKGKLKNIIIVTILLLILEYGVNYLLIYLLGHASPNDVLTVSYVKQNIPIMFINAILLGPILESLLFIYPFNKINTLPAFFVYTILFALSHLMYSNNMLDLLFIIPYILMSLGFYYSFYKTNNIFVSIIIHILNNLISFMLIFI
ncbi:MAG TPA: CPBP family glutamic-type intramembrane protease [Bacilli bacterium]|nr:CPBP family glutamic-type intramembrane protease [Bacilli bacterium]